MHYKNYKTNVWYLLANTAQMFYNNHITTARKFYEKVCYFRYYDDLI